MSDTKHYDRDYFEGRTSFFYRLTGYRDFERYFNRLARWFRPHSTRLTEERSLPTRGTGCHAAPG